jgi:hypothetical protein
MNNNKVANFLQTILGEYRDYNSSEFYFVCPLCQRTDRKKKLAINLDANDKSTYGQWHCWRSSNHRGSNLFSLLKKAGAGERISELKTIIKSSGINYDLSNISDELYDKQKSSMVYESSFPKEFRTFKDYSDDPEYKNALMYLKSRGITANDIAKHNIGFCSKGKYSGYIIIPSYDENMNVNYFVARRYYDGGMRYKNPPMSKNTVFNEIHINWNLPIILVEGIFDAIAVKRNAIPVLGHTIQSALRLKIFEKKVKDVYLCFDNDVVRDSMFCIEDFMRNGINVYYIDLPKKDPSDIGFKDMTLLLKSVKKMELQDLIQLKFSL